MKVRGKKNEKEDVKKKRKKVFKTPRKSGKKRNKESFFFGVKIKVGIEQWEDLDEKINWNVKTN